MTDPNLEWAILERQPIEVSRCLKTKSVGIAGLGGLGSVVAENLARAGVGHLVLVDFDVIEPSNLNRQRYFADQLGQLKTEALAVHLKRMSLFIRFTCYSEKVSSQNCSRLFQGCDVVVECLDDPENKADLLFGLRKWFPSVPVVAASGMAGLEGLDKIRIEKRMQHVYVVGDQTTDAQDGHGLFASKVGVVACMQSHVVIQLLAGVRE